MRHARWIAILATASLAGCSLTFDPFSPDVTLVDQPPSSLDAPRVRSIGGSVKLVRGTDGADWLLQFKYLTGPTVRLSRLAWPASDEVVEGSFNYSESSGEFTITERGSGGNPTKFTIRRVGDPPPWESFALPAACHGPWIHAKAIACSTESTRPPTLFIARRDSSYKRTVILGDENCGPASCSYSFQFIQDGGQILREVGSKDGKRLTVHSTTRERDTDLGLFTGRLRIEDDGVLACDGKGLRRVPLDGSGAIVLDKEPCLKLLLWGAQVLSCGSSGLRSIPLDGRDARVLDASPCNELSSLGQPQSWLSTRVETSAALPLLVCADLGLLFLPPDGSVPTVVDTRPCDPYASFLGGSALLDGIVLECSPTGLRTVPYDGSPARVLDPGPCEYIYRTGETVVAASRGSTLPATLHHDDVWYRL